MFERFTRAARTTVERAVTVAQDATAGEVRPEHLLVALLEQEDCLANRVLTGLGAPVGEVREVLDGLRLRYVDGLDDDDAEALQAIGIDLDEVVRRIDRNLGGPSVRRRRPPFSRGSKKVLQLALREALAMRHNYIGTERPGPAGGPGRRRHPGRVQGRAGGPAVGGGRCGPPRRMTRPDPAAGPPRSRSRRWSGPSRCAHPGEGPGASVVRWSS